MEFPEFCLECLITAFIDFHAGSPCPLSKFKVGLAQSAWKKSPGTYGQVLGSHVLGLFFYFPHRRIDRNGV